MIAEPEYQTYIPESWREMQRRERVSSARAGARRTIARQQRVAKLHSALQVTLRVLVTTAKVIGVAMLALMSVLLMLAAMLGTVNSTKPRGRRRRRR
jgi:multisubunit Na+/H+ antiporter MnhC subunit